VYNDTDDLQAGSIITTRFIMIISAMIISNKGHYAVWPCAKIAATISEDMELVSAYPACASYADGSNLDQVSAVLADMGGASAVNAGAALNVNMGMALWLASAVHALGVEIYVSLPLDSGKDRALTDLQLHLTPREAERLRQVSHTRQLEAGMHNPGSAGLTADRLGDAKPWVAEERRSSNDTLAAKLGEIEETK
jgi:hypothetical protein